MVYFLRFGFALKIDSEHRYATVISDTNRFLVRDFTGNFTVGLNELKLFVKIDTFSLIDRPCMQQGLMRPIAPCAIQSILLGLLFLGI